MAGEMELGCLIDMDQARKVGEPEITDPYSCGWAGLRELYIQ